MEPSEVTVRGWHVTGRVQGVGFRWWCLRTATRLHLRGTVRNRSDGSVEIRAAGIQPALDDFADLLSVGPLGARIDSVRELSVEGDLPPDFRVLS